VTARASPARVSDVRFVEASAHDVSRGLLGWVAFSIEGLRIDAVAVRRTRAGHVTLSWPAHRDRWGTRHYTIRPLDGASRVELEAQISRALREVGRLP
jgi:hypothetical protein